MLVTSSAAAPPACVWLLLLAPPRPTGPALLALTGLGSGTEPPPSIPPLVRNSLVSLKGFWALNVTNSEDVTSCWLYLTAGPEV